MTRKTVLITGATAGLGRATALLFARAGWHVIVGARTAAKAQAVVADIEAVGSSASTFIADLGNLDEVRQALATSAIPRLDGFVANAGLAVGEARTSTQGHELTFAVNVLAHQLIAVSLLDRYNEGARIVFLSSGTHLPDHPMVKRFGIPAPRWLGVQGLAQPGALTDVRQIYATSKLGSVLQARALAHHLQESGRAVDVYAFAPGLMPDTGLAREAPIRIRVMQKLVGLFLAPLLRDVRSVSTSSQHPFDLVSGDGWRDQGFVYVDGDIVGTPSNDAMNDTFRDGFWTDANQMVGMPPMERELPSAQPMI